MSTMNGSGSHNRVTCHIYLQRCTLQIIYYGVHFRFGINFSNINKEVAQLVDHATAEPHNPGLSRRHVTFGRNPARFRALNGSEEKLQKPLIKH